MGHSRKNGATEAHLRAGFGPSRPGTPEQALRDVLSYDKKAKRYAIRYEDGLTATINLTDPKSKDFVPTSNWQKV